MCTHFCQTAKVTARVHSWLRHLDRHDVANCYADTHAPHTSQSLSSRLPLRGADELLKSPLSLTIERISVWAHASRMFVASAFVGALQTALALPATRNLPPESPPPAKEQPHLPAPPLNAVSPRKAPPHRSHSPRPTIAPKVLRQASCVHHTQASEAVARRTTSEATALADILMAAALQVRVQKFGGLMSHAAACGRAGALRGCSGWSACRSGWSCACSAWRCVSPTTAKTPRRCCSRAPWTIWTSPRTAVPLQALPNCARRQAPGQLRAPAAALPLANLVPSNLYDVASAASPHAGLHGSELGQLSHAWPSHALGKCFAALC